MPVAAVAPSSVGRPLDPAGCLLFTTAPTAAAAAAAAALNLMML